MTPDTPIVADLEASRIDEADASALATAVL